MKKYLFLLSVVHCINTYAQQLPNSSFENWSLKEEYIEPDGWISTNAYAYFGAPETCYPFEDAHSGQWSAKLETRLDPITNDTLKAVMVLGSDYDAPGGAYAHRPQAFSFYYKHNLRDTAAAVVYLTKWNTTKQKKDTIAAGYTLFLDSTNVFNQRIIPLTYAVSGVVPDSCLILFVSSLKVKPNPGNYLIIDDLKFDGFLSTETVDTKPTINVYPNPFVDGFVIDAEHSIATYNLFTIDGRMVATGEGQQVNTALLQSGVYVLQVGLANGQTLHKRVTKQ